tara:strand:- start:2815 stop:4599 length:1785 start_codon:yes stop_codon:yes gene_type:complete
MSDIIVSSLAAQQRVIQTISNNVANASNTDYTEKNTAVVTNTIGGTSYGVTALPEVRNGDALRTEAVRVQSIEVSYLETLAASYSTIQRQMGQPGDQGALGSKMAALKTSLSTLEDAPATPGHQRGVLAKMEETVKYVNQLGKFFQDERFIAENGIQDSVDNVNRILTSLEDINGDIALADGRGGTTGSLQDKQDSLLKELSRYMDIQVLRRDNMALDVTTNTGQALLLRTGAQQLVFSKATSIGPTDTIATLGQISINGIDITGSISSGQIGAYLKARDVILPGMQAELDEFTEKFRDQMNAVHNQGSGFPIPAVLTGTRTFTTPGVTTMQMDGVVRIGIVDNTTGNYIAAPLDLDLTAGPQTINAVVAAINLFLGADGTAALNADDQLVLTATNANQGIALVSMTDPEAKELGSGLGFSHHFGLNDLFTTGTRFIQDGVAGIVGLTQSLDIRADIKATPEFLSRSMASTEPFVTHPNAIQPGDGRLITKMMAAFDESLAFATAGPMSGRSESLMSYANSIWHNAAVDAKNNQSLFDVQSTILADNETDLIARTRVNMQSQIAQLMEAQRIYAASSKMLQASKEMLQQLMSAI